MKLRFYTICSSKNKQFSITVGGTTIPSSLHADQENKRRLHHGLCSSFLSKLQVGDIVQVFVRKSSFHLPSTLSSPIILCATGTAISPFLGFVEEREGDISRFKAAKAVGSASATGDVGKCSIIYGCGKKDFDCLYHSDFRQACWNGVIDNLEIAFSAEPNQGHIQHIISKQRNYIFEVLVHQRGFFYFCGDPQIAQEIWSLLIVVIQSCGNMSKEEATIALNKLEADRHYVSEVWGVVSGD